LTAIPVPRSYFRGLLLLLLLASSASCAVHPRSAADCRPDAEELSVLRAFVDVAVERGVYERVVVVPVDQEYEWEFWLRDAKMALQLLTLSEQTAVDFKKRNERSLCFFRADRAAVGARSAPLLVAEPRTLFAYVSHVGFNADRTEALFYTVEPTSGVLHAFKRQEGGWREVGSQDVWSE